MLGFESTLTVLGTSNIECLTAGSFNIDMLKYDADSVSDNFVIICTCIPSYP